MPSPVPSRPFTRGSFDELPDLPRLPHPYFRTEAHDVELDTRAFGRARMRYRTWGDGEPLLLVHGLMTSSYSWRYVLDALGARYRLFIPDLLGSGHSDMPVGRYGAPELAETIAAFVAATGIRGCRAIGNSLGGYLCMRAALSDPGVFSRLVNLHSPGLPEARLRALWAAIRLPLARSLIAWLPRRDPERWVHRNVHYWDESRKSREEAREYAAPLATEAGARAFAAILADVLHPRDTAEFQRTLEARRDRGESFPVPLLMVYARQDPMVPPVIGERLARLVPSARLAWMEETSHFPHVDSPERLLTLVTPFLDGA